MQCLMGLVVWQQLEGRQFDISVAELQVSSCLCQFCNVRSLECLMGNVVSQ
ncbi:unnamed protein product [Staurois parvus]|uniref:Uncharacterized protein n=1 Tax=Staurois parvus TaxID=386267 RepID=A0ABN9HFD3_9NEOB|nr:unnamed protein product [Staurois parvus]